MFKKVYVPLLSLSLLFSVVAPFEAVAKDNNHQEVIDLTPYVTEKHKKSIEKYKKTIDQLMKEYNLQKVDKKEVQADVATIQVDNAEELQIFLESIKVVDGETTVTDKQEPTDGVNIQAVSTIHQETTKYYYTLVNSTAVTLWADFSVESSGSFRYITGVTPGIFAKEYGYGNQFVNGRTSYSLNTGKTTAWVTGKGDIKQLITTPAGDIVYTYDPVEMQLTYNLY